MRYKLQYRRSLVMSRSSVRIGSVAPKVNPRKLACEASFRGFLFVCLSFLAILGQIRYNTTIENHSVMEEMDV